eukprot:3528284-Rhodomonas_salina.1
MCIHRTVLAPISAVSVTFPSRFGRISGVLTLGCVGIGRAQKLLNLHVHSKELELFSAKPDPSLVRNFKSQPEITREDTKFPPSFAARSGLWCYRAGTDAGLWCYQDAVSVESCA